MKFLIDENIGMSVFYFLRKEGFDVSSIAHESPGITDEEVLKKAICEKRILITLDKDFGDLVFYSHLPHRGVVLLRLKSQKPGAKIKALKSLLKFHLKKISNSFIVLSENKIRIRT